jgi:hypothetical protein
MNKRILWGLIGLFFASNIATATYFLMQQKEKLQIIPEIKESAVDNVVSPDSYNDFIEVNQAQSAEWFLDKEPLATSEEELKIDWLKIPERFSPADTTENIDACFQDGNDTHFYKTGIVTSGKYKGSHLLVKNSLCFGMGCETSLIKGVYFKDHFIILAKSSPSGWLNNEEVKCFQNGTTIDFYSSLKSIDPPVSLDVPNKNYKLSLSYWSDFPVTQDKLEELKEAFISDNGLVLYTRSADASNSDLVFKSLDGIFYYYSIEPPFSNVEDRLQYNAQLDIKLTNGNNFAADYSWCKVGGCGCNIFLAPINIDQVNKIGMSQDGSSFYELKDINLVFPEQGISDIQKMYDEYFPGYNAGTEDLKEKIPYDQFVKDYPIIYWQDFLGRFWQLKNTKYYFSAVECGKPVIYLYPEKTTDVNVQVFPAGGFTKTEPAYKNGWNVKASPNGDIYNYDDKINYPYLFWEGHALGYNMPTTGFVVEASKVESFLRDKLSKQGLIGREIDEFVEFWAPKMTEAPYYFVTFVPQADFEKLAPLSVSPKPDTVIRVFMDYQPLEKPVRVKEQILRTPVRNGFTVVEWGGALHK